MKKLISLMLAVILCLSLSATAFADYTAPACGEASDDSVSVQRAEQTEWVYRIYNGNVEKRLWSRTYAKWLTDWIYVCPAPDT